MAVDYHEYIKTEAWRARAEAAKQRVGHRCQICNRPAARVTLDVLHRTYERLGNEHPEDLTVLCRGCHELYEKNRRIPSPPPAPPVPAQPLPPAQLELANAQSSKQPAALNGVASRRPFAPARISPQRATLNTAEATAELRLLPEADHSYALAVAEAASPAASHYQLTTEHNGQPTPIASAKAYRPHRRLQVGIALLVAVTLLLVAGLYDLVTLTPNALRPLTINTPQPAAIPSVAPPLETPPAVATVVNSRPTPTVTQEATVVQPTLAPTLPPTLAPTLAPTTTPLPPTPTSAPPTVAPAPQNSVLRTGLVCSKPCSCAPVARTIAQGTPVTVLHTQLCGSDTWYQIGETEWLGPGLIEPQ